MTGVLHSIESFATLDGTGIRCALFFSGCPLRCKCCHNADTWSGRGTEYTPEALFARVKRFRPYFSNGGGVTLSGGEPLLQAGFLIPFCKLLREAGIQIALDTSGCVAGGETDELLGLVDLAIVDLKCPTEERYRDFCGGSLDRTLEFLHGVSKRGIPLRLRTVVIPGINDKESDMRAYADLARPFRPEKYELLGFHTMGFSKFEEAGLVNPLAEVPAMDPGRLSELQNDLDDRMKGFRGRNV